MPSRPEGDRRPDDQINMFWPVTFIVLGVLGAASAIGWASIVWHFDALITPKGQVTVALTTVSVMCLFLGFLKWWLNTDARKREAADTAAMVRERQVADGLDNVSAQIDRVIARQDILGGMVQDCLRQTEAVRAEQHAIAQQTAHCAETLDKLDRRIPHPVKLGGGPRPQRDSRGKPARQRRSDGVNGKPPGWAEGYVAGVRDRLKQEDPPVRRLRIVEPPEKP